VALKHGGISFDGKNGKDLVAEAEKLVQHSRRLLPRRLGLEPHVGWIFWT